MRILRRAFAEARRRHLAAAPASRDTLPDLSRRRAIAAGGAVLGGSLTPAWAHAARKLVAPQVAIVGAGLAGLTAAHTLRKAGIHATVLEASSRIGGRCYSERTAFAEGQLAERGGEFIDTVHESLIGLAGELQLELDDVLEAQPPGTEAYTYLDGTAYTVEEATQDFAPLYPLVQSQAERLGNSYGYGGSSVYARKLDRTSAGDWIAKHVPGGRASRLGRLMANAFTEEMAAEVDLLSAITVVVTLAGSPREEFAAYAGSDQRFHVRGGNDQLASHMAGLLQGPIETGARLLALQRAQDGRCLVTVQRDGAIRTHTFDRVVVAIPFTLLREVDFARAGFRALKARAIRELPMGTSTKLQLQFDERVWNRLQGNGEVRLEGSFHSTWEVSRAQPGTAGVLNCWSGGRLAVAAAEGSREDAARRALRDLELPFPGISSNWNGRVIRDAWHANPWSRGSYAYYPPGWYTTLYGIESEREGNWFFAGEHTSYEWQGFLNGAVESGLRAAGEVLASVGMKLPRRSAA
jgi:monoamine oxidase